MDPKALESFFARLPEEILWTYRNRYLDKPISYETPEQVREALVPLFLDESWVKGRLRKLKTPHHRALIALMQCGGVAGGIWLLEELSKAHGGNETYWRNILGDLGFALFVFGNNRQTPPGFYTIPSALVSSLSRVFSKRLKLPTSSGKVSFSRDTNFRHPVGFSLVSFLTYMETRSIRITQREEIFKKQQEEMDLFFQNLWGGAMQDRVRNWHLTLLRDLGLVRPRRGYLIVEDGVVQEWLRIPSSGRRDLYVSAFNRREPLAQWLLETLEAAPEEDWIPLDTLRTRYRRWYMGAVFQKRFIRKTYFMPSSGVYNDSPPFEYLQLAGLIERGLTEEGSFVRLSSEGRQFLAGKSLGESVGDGEESTFHIQPNFEVFCPAGTALDVVHGLGVLADLISADRMNRYQLTEASLRRALDAGWRGDEVFNFLTDNSTHGIPPNVASTIADWIGDFGEVEFHDALIMKVRTERLPDVVKLLKDRRVPHKRLARTIFAVPRTEHESLMKSLKRRNMSPSPTVYSHDIEDEAADGSGIRARLADKRRLPVDAILDHRSDPIEFPVRQVVVLHNHSAESVEDRLPPDGRGISFGLGDSSQRSGEGWRRLKGARLVEFLKHSIRRGHDIEISMRAVVGDAEVFLISPARVKDDEDGKLLVEGYDHQRTRGSTWRVDEIDQVRLLE